MEICDRTFELAESHLKKLNYNGPVGLSCDDTQLFSTLKLYWSKTDDCHYLIGATDGPIRVLDPDHMKEVLADAQKKKAPKVSDGIDHKEHRLLIDWIRSESGFSRYQLPK